METKPENHEMGAWESVIRTVSSLLKTFEQELREAEGLPLAWYDVLVQLIGAPEGQLRMQALADIVVISRSGLTRLIDRMENAGLVRREPCDEDRRGYYAILTGQGREAFDRAKPIHEQGIHEHFTRNLDEVDLQAVAAAFAKVRRANNM